MRNEYKKITFEDEFARKFYSDKSSRAIKKQENKRNKKIMRRYNKKIINEELKRLDKDMYWWYNVIRRTRKGVNGKIKRKYRVYCIMNNLVETERGFKNYKIDQEMLERIRNKKKKAWQKPFHLI